MNWTLVFVLIALVIYVIYNIVSLKMFGVPSSLSETFYLFKEKKEWMKYLFPIMMVSLVVFLMPAWLEISAGSVLQFLAFLAAASIAFVGAAPTFKNGGMDYRVHSISAYCAALFSILWVILVSKLWIMPIIWLVLITLLAILTKSVKTSTIYWLETVAFMSTFMSIMVYCL
jgi:hypothetical protein